MIVKIRVRGFDVVVRRKVRRRVRLRVRRRGTVAGESGEESEESSAKIILIQYIDASVPNSFKMNQIQIYATVAPILC